MCLCYCLLVCRRHFIFVCTLCTHSLLLPLIVLVRLCSHQLSLSVLIVLISHSLRLKAEKCEFPGFLVSRGRIEVDPAKTEAVVSWPPPTNRKELQQFLGFANFYRRFICGFSSTVQPLTALTSTKSMFHRTPEAEAAFSDLKTRFSTAAILIMPNPEKQFILEVNASDTGVGAVLSQRGPQR